MSYFKTAWCRWKLLVAELIVLGCYDGKDNTSLVYKTDILTAADAIQRFRTKHYPSSQY